MVGEVVKNTGATVQSWGMIYKSVVQLVLLYGSKSWVLMGAMLKVLELFHYQVARRIVGMTAWSATSGEWYWPPVDEAMDTSSL